MEKNEVIDAIRLLRKTWKTMKRVKSVKASRILFATKCKRLDCGVL